jgi:hypothetical protein
MRSRSLPLLALACLLGLAGSAIAATGRDLRSCYAFSDTFPPLAAGAPAPDFSDIALVGTPVTFTGENPERGHRAAIRLRILRPPLHLGVGIAERLPPLRRR